MILSGATVALLAVTLVLDRVDGSAGPIEEQAPLGGAHHDAFKTGEGCPDYKHYSAYPQWATSRSSSLELEGG